VKSYKNGWIEMMGSVNEATDHSLKLREINLLILPESLLEEGKLDRLLLNVDSFALHGVLN